jgi:hypothetical protein
MALMNDILAESSAVFVGPVGSEGGRSPFMADSGSSGKMDYAIHIKPASPGASQHEAELLTQTCVQRTGSGKEAGGRCNAG